MAKKSIKEIIVWCFTKPIIKIYFIPDEERQFKEHANKFLHPDAIKPEHRKGIDVVKGIKDNPK